MRRVAFLLLIAAAISGCTSPETLRTFQYSIAYFSQVGRSLV